MSEGTDWQEDASDAGTRGEVGGWAAGLGGLRSKLLIAVALGALAFAVMSFYADFRKLAGALYLFSWGYLPALLGLAFANYVLRFFKWHYYLSCLGVHIGRGDSFAVFLAGLTMSVTPGKFGEVLKAYLVKQLDDTPVSCTAPIVLAERFTDFLALVVLAAAGVLVLGYGAKVLVLSVAILLFLFVLIGYRAFWVKLMGMLSRFPRWATVAGRLSVAYESIAEMMGGKNLLVATALSIPAWFCECYGLYLALKGLSVSVPVFDASFVYAFSTIVGALTMLPGGLVVTEGSMTGALVFLLDTPRHLAVAATFIVRICTLWFAVAVGAVALMGIQRRIRRRE